MSKHIDGIIRIINTVYSGPQLTDDSFKHLKTVENVLASHGDDVKDGVANYYKNNAWPLDNELSLILFLHKTLNFKDNGFFLSQKLDQLIPKMNSPEDFSEIFWNIARINFTRTSNSLGIPELRGCFHDISNRLKDFLKPSAILKTKKTKRIKRIAIISPQILGMRHSPTREAFNIACHLEAHHACEVFIFNTNGMNYSNNFQIYDPMIANHVSGFSGKKSIKIDYMEFVNKTINLISFPAERMSTRKIADILQALSFLEVDAVISHGENLFIQDAIYQTVPSIFATTGGVVPFAHSDAYWVPGNLLTSTLKDTALKYGHADFMEESMLVTPEGRADEVADRSLFSLPDDAVIYLVVSTRMVDEIDSSFSGMCTKLLNSNRKAYILLAGVNDINLEPLFDKEMVRSQRIINAGFQNDLPAICLMSDIYLNPFRMGGGTSSQTAILNGLPVVTMNYGHISAVVPVDHRLNSWDDYLSYAIRLGEDKSFMEEEQNLFMEHFCSVLQAKKQIEKIFNKLQVIAEAKY
ncbi:MAG: hypothetical protein U9N63_05835 [Pseudomonadota bacterium]|nr:hypothetical protein [Pseudomonadota bacterium]